MRNALSGPDRRADLTGPGLFEALAQFFGHALEAGQALTYRFSTHEKGRPIHYYRASHCRDCALKSRCTRNQANRTLTRLAFKEVQEAMAERVKANPQLMRKRKAIIEHVFGTLKRTFGYDHFLCRGKRAVSTEVHLTVLAYNLKRLSNILSFPRLLAALS